MDAQEKAVIDGIFERLKTVSGQPRDAEVEQYIADRIRQQPYAPYALAQSVYVQEQALLNASQEIEALKAENLRLQARPTATQGGGFLSGLFGGGASQARPHSHVPAFGQSIRSAPSGHGVQNGAGPGPWGQQQPQRQGMGFLGTAAAAAAGVAGGMVIGSMLSSALGGGAAQAASAPLTLANAEPPPQDDGFFSPDEFTSPAGFEGGGDFGGDSFDI